MKGLEKLSWKELREQIKQIQPELCEIIDDLSPPDEYSLYVGTYPYGAMILDSGIFQIVNDYNVLVPLTHSSINKEAKRDLSYTRTIPMAVILENSIETFFCISNRTIPSSFYTPGDMISLWRVLEGESSYQEGSLWNISSGARTICMLPKITDNTSHEFLKKKYNLKTHAPVDLTEHWSTFVRIANHNNFSQPWYSRLMFFSENWSKHSKDKNWSRFYQFILNKAWQDSTFKRNQFIFDFAFSLAQKSKNLKPNPYLADTVKHLIGIGAGGVPGLAPAINDIAAPITGLQQTYIEEYRLKKHAPIIMHLHPFTLGEKRPVYYSLSMPTTIIFSPRSSKALSKMVDIRQLKHILDAFISETINGKLLIEKTPLFDLAKNVSYKFYHTEKDIHEEILPVTFITEDDLLFQKILGNFPERAFPEFSPFINGCVAISQKAEDKK